MNSVMLDNWMLSDVLCDIYNIRDNTVSESYQKFLFAIVLWDKIYYPNNELSPYMNPANGTISSILKPIDDITHSFADEADAMYKEYFNGEYSEIIVKGAMRYLLLSSHNKCDYLPCEARQKTLACANFIELNRRISRSNSLDFLNDAINEYFIELFSKLGATNFTIKTPILTDYIIQTTPDEMSYIDRALHLKYEGPVEKYRKYLSDMENAFRKSDYRLLIDMKNYSENLVKDIRIMDSKNISVVNCTILPIPSISFTKEVQLKGGANLAFLDELGKFAVNGRKL